MTSPPGKIRVLVVDDDVSVLRALTRNLAAVAEVTVAENAREGRQALAAGAFDVVVSDYAMPGEDGISFLEHVATAQPATVRFLFSGADPTNAEDALNDGVLHGLYRKGSAMRDLVQRLKEIAESHGR